MGFSSDMGLGVVLEAQDLFTGPMGAGAAAFGTLDGRAKSADASFKDMARSVGAVGLGMTALGTLGLAALSATLAKARDFNAGIAEITTLTDEASLSTLRLSGMVMEMNATYGGSAAKQTKALYDGISAGASNAAEAQALMVASNRLAVSGRAEVGVALDGLTSSVNAYGDSFANAKNYSDAMFTAVQKGKTTIPELAAVIGRVAPTAAAMGVSFDQVAASIAAVTLKGIKTEEAVTGMKATLAGIIRPTSDAAAEAARLGIKFTAAELRAKGFDGFLKQITGSAKFNKDSLAKLFSSVEALNTVLALTANGSSAFNGALDAMKTKGGATDKAFEKMSDTLAFQQKRMEGLKENASILIGEVLEPGAAVAVKFGNALLQAFNTLPDGVRNFLVKGFALTSTLLVIVGTALTAAAGVGLFMSALTTAGVTLGGVLAVLAPLVLLVGALGLAFVGLRYAYEHNLGGMGDSVRAAIDKIRLGWNALMQLFEQGGFSGEVREELNRAENGGVKAFVTRLFVYGKRIEHFLEQVSKGFGKTLDEGGSSFGGLLKAVDGLMSAFDGLYKAIDPEGAKDAWKGAGSKGERFGQMLGKALELAVIALTKVIVLIGDAIAAYDRFKGAVKPAGDAVDYFTTKLDLMKASLPGFGKALDDTGAHAPSFAGTVIESLLWAKNATDAALSGMGGSVEGYMGVLRGSGQIIRGILEGDWAEAWQGVRTVIDTAISSATTMLGALLKVLGSFLDAMGKLVGKDLGLGSAAEAFAADLQKDLATTIDIASKGTPLAKVPASASVVNPGALNLGEISPSLSASAPGLAGGGDMAAVAQAAAAGAASQSKESNTSVDVKVYVGDQEVLARIEAAKRDSDARGGAPTLPVVD